MVLTEEAVSTNLESVVIQGDLSSLSPRECVLYYKKVCESLGLNPLTKPFDYLVLDGKKMLYARKDATEQLRTIRGISISKMDSKTENGVYIVVAHAIDKEGRTDISTGAVSLVKADGEWTKTTDKYGKQKSYFKKSGTFTPLAGDDLANAIMKAETKAKRRVTLSISGLGLLDETEVSSVLGARTESIDLETGEICLPKKTASKSQIKKLKELVEICPHPTDLIKKEFKKEGATSYSDMTEECAIKMIKWLGSELDAEVCKLEDEQNEIQQGSKVA